MKSLWYEFQVYYKNRNEWHSVGGEQDSLKQVIREADDFEFSRDKRTKKVPVRIVQFNVTSKVLSDLPRNEKSINTDAASDMYAALKMVRKSTEWSCMLSEEKDQVTAAILNAREYDEDDLRELFWETHHNFSEYAGRRQNDCPANVRMAWCDFIEQLVRDKEITEDTARKVSL